MLHDTTTNKLQPLAFKLDFKFPGGVGKRKVCINPSHFHPLPTQVLYHPNQHLFQIELNKLYCFQCVYTLFFWCFVFTLVKYFQGILLEKKDKNLRLLVGNIIPANSHALWVSLTPVDQRHRSHASWTISHV